MEARKLWYVYGQSALKPDQLNSGDTAWMLASTALVLLMTIPGLALFYSGMVGYLLAILILNSIVTPIDFFKLIYFRLGQRTY